MGDDFVLPWVTNVVSAAAVLGCIYALIAAVLVLRFGARSRLEPGTPEPLTVLKPLCENEPGLLGRLASFCSQDYGAQVQIVFGAQDRADRSIAVVENLKAVCRDKTIDLKIDPRSHGTNRKVSNLANMVPLAQHGVLVVSDSDIDVGPTYLSDIAAELNRPGVGAVTCLYHGVPGSPGIWSRLSALSTNTHFLPNAITALTFGLAHPCFGSTIAVRRETLEQIGGFAAFADCLADDYAVGEAVRAAGYEIAVPPFSVGHVSFETSWRGLMGQHIRAAKTIKGIDPIGYFGAIITNPFALAVIAAILGSDDALLVAAAAIVCRTLLCLAVERTFQLERQQYWLIPVWDLVEFAIFVASFFGGKISWRGYRYRLMPDGTLLQDSQ